MLTNFSNRIVVRNCGPIWPLGMACNGAGRAESTARKTQRGVRLSPGGDTKIPILTKGQADTGRIGTARDDRPVGAEIHRRALFYASRDRRSKHAVRHLQNFAGILQADAYGSFNALFDAERKALPAPPAFCWA